MKRFTSPHQKTGLQGERFACDYLVQNGYRVIDTNFSCRFGEVDIIAKKGQIFHFLEVKSITKKPIVCFDDKRKQFEYEYRSVTNPFQNITMNKKRRLIKTVEYYLQYKKISSTLRFQIDGIGIVIDDVNQQMNCTIIPNIII